MMDAELILGYLTPRVFALAMLMDVVNSVLLPIGNKGILRTLSVIDGNEKEQEEIRKAIHGIIWRYLPMLFFLFTSILQMNLSLDIYAYYKGCASFSDSLGLNLQPQLFRI